MGRTLSHQEIAQEYPGWTLLNQSLAKELYLAPEDAWNLLQGDWPYDVTDNFPASKQLLLAFMDSLGPFVAITAASKHGDDTKGIVLLMEGGLDNERALLAMANAALDVWHASPTHGMDQEQALAAMRRTCRNNGMAIAPEIRIDAALVGRGQRFHGQPIPVTMFVTLVFDESLRVQVSESPWIQRFRDEMA